MSEKPVHLALFDRPWARYEHPKALQPRFVTLACSDVWAGVSAALHANPSRGDVPGVREDERHATG